jgi:D-amino peptidase
VKVWIGVDMEGIAGISHPDVTVNGHEGYPAACALMTGEASAAVRGACDGGATDVLVNDGHGRMLNLDPGGLDPRARLLQGQKTWSAMEGAGPNLGTDVALLVGYHARAGHPTGTISHTYTSRATSTRLNGRPVGEAGLHAAVLGTWGVPVGMVAGDDTLADEVQEWIPWARHVVVKKAFGRHSAASLHPSRSQDLIEEAAREAMQRSAEGRLRRLELSSPVVIEVDYQTPVQADYAAFLPGAERVGERGVKVRGDNAAEAFRAFLCGVRLSGLVP